MRMKPAAKPLIIAWTLMKKKELCNPELLKIKEYGLFGERARGNKVDAAQDLVRDNQGPHKG